MIARIVINKHIVKMNAMLGKDEPPISIQTSKGVERAHTVSIHVPRGAKPGDMIAVLVYRPDKPLKCGASVWLEVERERLVHSVSRSVKARKTKETACAL